MKKVIQRLWKDESAASAAEYALLLSIVAIGIVVAVVNLSTAISTKTQEAATTIDTGAPAGT